MTPNHHKAIKKKKCKACGELFTPFTTTAKACSPRCAVELVNLAKEKKARRDLREGRIKLRKKSEWLDIAQIAFNAFIRERDKHQSCISCGTQKWTIQYCAGHYLTRGGHPELRFDEDNAHKQCNTKCNLNLSGNIAAYRINLVKKIGVERVEILEGKHDPKHYNIDDIKAITKTYRLKTKQLKEVGI